ncbi:von Willebrand factor C domain-containing protein 2-like isoform X1 [Haliotis rufescens]|uniref:von Willebrand factor C domain-containing protein 2-like isoform X1 n=1 Tax=Haliotis rufescens TaxID=6454 RepID=UPI00201F9D84|nr:von Willebrand factor C domain-containing protein 2-like isoform X1 [Haliotis rufescens]
MIGTVVSSAVLLALVVYSESASLPVVAVAVDKCVHQNKTYMVGEKTDSACMPCECTPSGRMACLVIDCFFAPPCVDHVTKPGQCCATCPNGRNCKFGDHIIKEGETYKPDTKTECKCNTHVFGMASLKAVCATTASIA